MEKEENAQPISDKEVKPETIDTDSKTPPTTSQGEYKEAATSAIKSFYGEDEEITDDNYGAKMEEMIAKDYTPTKEKNSKFEEANKNVLAMMEDNPALGGILSDMGMGAKFEQALPKYLDLQALIDSKGGDEKSWEENNKARMERFDQIEAHKATLAENEKKSLETVKEFMAEKKMEGENADQFGKYVATMLDLANSGDLSTDFLEGMYYAMNYKKDIAMAEEKGKVAAKNEKIEETMKSEEDLKKGDGTPAIKSGDEKVAAPEPEDFADRLERSLKNKKSVV